jgi:hypothetical protein
LLNHRKRSKKRYKHLKTFGDGINKEFGLEKCAKLHLKEANI